MARSSKSPRRKSVMPTGRGGDNATSGGSLVRFRFEAALVYWRGPSPFLFAPVPADHVARIRLVARAVTYGWGMIPVEASIAGIFFTTSLFPKDGTYFLPIKTAVSRKAHIEPGDPVRIEMVIRQTRL